MEVYSIYVNLGGYDQLIFYWNHLEQKQHKPPVSRATKTPIGYSEVKEFTEQGCTLIVDGKRANFVWGKKPPPSSEVIYKGLLDDPLGSWMFNTMRHEWESQDD